MVGIARAIISSKYTGREKETKGCFVLYDLSRIRENCSGVKNGGQKFRTLVVDKRHGRVPRPNSPAYTMH